MVNRKKEWKCRDNDYLNKMIIFIKQKNKLKLTQVKTYRKYKPFFQFFECPKPTGFATQLNFNLLKLLKLFHIITTDDITEKHDMPA